MGRKFDPNRKSRGYAFTIFAENEDFDDDIICFLNDHEEQYKCFGFEKCPTTGKLHMQGYMYFKNPVIGRKVLSIFKSNAHWEQAVRSSQVNINYCSKDNDFYEFGDRPNQGVRSDIDELKEDILNGSTVKEVSLSHTNLYMRYSGAIEKFSMMHKPINTECTVYHAKYDNYLTVCDHLWETSLAIDEEKKLAAYNENEHEAVIFTQGMNVYLLTQFLRNKPAIISQGWQLPPILPKVVVFFDKFWKSENNNYGYLVNELPKDIPTDHDSGTEVLEQKCLGNTSQEGPGPDPSEGFIEEIKIYNAFEKEAIYAEAKRKGTYGGVPS